MKKALLLALLVVSCDEKPVRQPYKALRTRASIQQELLGGPAP